MLAIIVFVLGVFPKESSAAPGKGIFADILRFKQNLIYGA